MLDCGFLLPVSLLTVLAGNKIFSQKEKVRLDLERVEEEISLAEAQAAEEQQRYIQAQATRRQKKLRLRKQLNLLTDRERTTFAQDLLAIEELERVEYDAAVRGEIALPEGHPYEAALARGVVVPPGQAPPSPSQLPVLADSSSGVLDVDWTSDFSLSNPDSDFWKTVGFAGETGQQPVEPDLGC
jgi:hypothetical protein